MKKIFILICFLIAASHVHANDDVLDSLKQKLQNTKNDTLKGALYTKIAGEYLKFDTIINRNVRNYYQTEAIHWSLQALHNYAFYEDTTGMRKSFDDLARVYIAQRKFSQAKWFLLQSTNISRRYKDYPAVINSLIKLANVKIEIKENKLAMRDLNEALAISLKRKLPKMEAIVQQNYAYLYNRLNDPEKGDIAAKRVAELNEKIKKDEELKALAVIASQDSSIVSKKPDSIKKKKVYTVKKPIKVSPSTAKKLASL